MTLLKSSFITFILILSSTTGSAGDIKKWVDDTGRVFYGDSPPPSVTTQTIKTSKRPTNIGRPLPRLSTSGANQQTTTSAPPQNLGPEQAKVACENAKKDLSVIKSSTRIQLRSADGSLRYMTKNEIKERLKRSNNDIRNYCQ